MSAVPAVGNIFMLPVLLTGKPEASSYPFIKTVSEQDLSDIDKTLQGDDRGFSRLVKKYQTMVTAVMWRFSRDVTIVEELVQDVFIQVYSSLRTYKGKAPFEFWVKTIATRTGYRFWKRKKAGKQDLQVLWESFKDKKQKKPSPEAVAEFTQDLLQELKPKDRLVITLFYFEQCSIEQIADRTGFTAGTVKMRIHRARKKLSCIISKEKLTEISEWIKNI